VKYKSAQSSIAEVKQFLCLVYGSLIRFYSSVIKLETLEKMREDLIEALTKLLFNDRMSSMLVAMCRICTRDEERTLVLKITELQKLKPSQIGLNEYFALDKHSIIWKVFAEQFKEVDESRAFTGDDGDVGGSSGSNDDKTDG
jgi:hypothetical protein